MDQSNQRYRSLDGLRGIAATSVVAYHALLVVPAISVLYIEHAQPSAFSPGWWLYQTPLRLLVPGHEAVLVFFVLSGFVLTLPLLNTALSVRRLLAYYGRRLVRLYVPVWGAILCALFLAMLVPRHVEGGSSWLATHHVPTVSDVKQDAMLLFGTTNLDSPLWSLTWEVWFSLLLPLLFVMVKIVRLDRWWVGGLLLLSVISACAQLPQLQGRLPQPFLAYGLLEYMPVFVIGMILALKRSTLARLGRQVQHWPTVAVAACLMALSPTILISNSPIYRAGDAVLAVICLFGVAGLVFVALEAPRFRVLLERRVPQWLGTRSFSIYLVHEPLIVSVAILTNADNWLPWLFVSVVLFPVVLLVADLFYRMIEHRAHLLARRTGRAIARTSRGRLPVSAELVQPIKVAEEQHRGTP